MTVNKIGETRIGVVVPSTLGKAIASFELIEKWRDIIGDLFEEKFGGATYSLQYGKWNNIREDSTFVWAACMHKDAAAHINSVLELAADMCADMDQQCVMVVWGEDTYLVTR